MISTVQVRLGQVCSWRDDREPAFQFEEVLQAHDAAVAELEQLRTQIAVANATTRVEVGGETILLAAAIRRMTELKGRHVMFSGLHLQSGTEREVLEYDDRGRPVTEERQWKSIWTEPERAAKLERLQDQMEDLSEAIEEANHRTRLGA